MNRPPPSFTAGRRWSIALHVLLAMAALIIIVLALNMIAARHSFRFHLTNDPAHRLSPMTVSLLDSITNEVRIIVFFDRREPLYSPVAELVRQYESASSRIEVEYLDYVLWPGRAQQVQLEYGLGSSPQTDRIIFHGNGKTRIVYESQLSDYDYSGILKGEEIKRTAFKGERLFTSAIYSLIDPKQPAAYFLQGHAEQHDPEDKHDSTGYSRFAALLKENNIAVGTLSLLTNDVPPDALLVIAAPRTTIPRAELDKIEAFLKQGGRLLVLFSVLSQGIEVGIERLLADWGVDVGHNFVDDGLQGKSGEAQTLIVNTFGDHPIVRPLLRSRLQLVYPRSITPQAPAEKGPDAGTVSPLVFTSDEGRALVNIQSPRVQRRGRIPLMAAIEKGNIQGVSADRGATRIVVAGESLFLGNALIETEGNRDFAILAVNWLLNRDQLLDGIGPRPLHEYRLTLSESEMHRMRWIMLGAMPGSILFLGFIVWLRRRS